MYAHADARKAGARCSVYSVGVTVNDAMCTCKYAAIAVGRFWQLTPILHGNCQDDLRPIADFRGSDAGRQSVWRMAMYSGSPSIGLRGRPSFMDSHDTWFSMPQCIFGSTASGWSRLPIETAIQSERM